MADLKDDIEKYLNGKLSPEEMHALEKRALDDPFLSEALEGAVSINTEDFSKDVSAINSAIGEKRKKSPIQFWTWPLRIAAGLVLLAVSTYIVFTLTGSEETKKDSIALNKEMQEVPQESAVKKSDSVIIENFAPEEVVESDQTEKNVPKSPLVEESKVVERKSETSDSPVEIEETVDAITSADKADEVIVTERAVAADRAKTENENYSLEQSELKKKSVASETSRQRRGETQPVPSTASGIGFYSKQIKGKVTDVDDGLPLPGVNVLVKDSKVGTTTDLNGNFEINIPENQSNLVFSFIGMESKEITIASNDKPEQINVQLAPDISELSEVVVTGYGTGDEQEFEGTKWELTEPVGGKKAYKNYLEKNLRYPEVALENDVQGKVTIQFTVEPSGQLTDFRVVKSLGSNCDEELLRLIKEGPKWTATKRNDEPVKSKAKVKMRFSLPKKK